ncbi:hypothetical protein BC936DRAFT_148210 [Jimgerdemannia flammicorona]|uniref:OTU domain-containing protein n=1 Tax=Jimgerdemannia flammicorona TaxID=994334 RepID=A0A433D3K6_9FUNG|nr:hypothetical protein BC936DRAFT_148210 [Jimgerdemannia flammicorona]
MNLSNLYTNVTRLLPYQSSNPMSRILFDRNTVLGAFSTIDTTADGNLSTLTMDERSQPVNSKLLRPLAEPDTPSRKPGLRPLTTIDLTVDGRSEKPAREPFPTIDLTVDSGLQSLEISEGRGRPRSNKRIRLADEPATDRCSKAKIYVFDEEAEEAEELATMLDPCIPQAIVRHMYNVKDDGNCGFRSLAIAIRGDEEDWSHVKTAMRAQFEKRDKLYRDWLCYEMDRIRRILACTRSPCPKNRWFLLPDCAQIAADTFRAPVVALCGETRTLFLPIEKKLDATMNMIVLQWVNGNHIVLVELKRDARISLPILNPQHEPMCKLHGLWDGLDNVEACERWFGDNCVLIE